MIRRALGGALVPLLVAVVACACAPAGTAVPASPVEGVVVDVDSPGLGQVRGFTLRTADGMELDFEVDQLQNATEFPPSHLTEHMASAEPVRVTFLTRDGALVAVTIEDATPP